MKTPHEDAKTTEQRSCQGKKMTESQNAPIDERRVQGHQSNPMAEVQPRNILFWIRATRPRESSVMGAGARRALPPGTHEVPPRLQMAADGPARCL